jgi:hypothetical protein
MGAACLECFDKCMVGKEYNLNIFNHMKIGQIIAFGFILLNFIVRWVFITKIRSYAAFWIMFYVLFFASIGVAVEYGKFKSRNRFYLLNFGWGKACLSLLEAFLLLGAGTTDPHWNDVLTSVILILLSICYFLVSILYRGKEVEAITAKIEELDAKDKEDALAKKLKD